MGFFSKIANNFHNKKIVKQINEENSSLRVIKNINSVGFEMYDLYDNLKNQFSWSNIKTIRFSSDYSSLEITDKSEQVHILEKRFSNWYALIQKMLKSL